MRRILTKYRHQNAIRREFEFMPATIEVLERPPAPFTRVMVLLIVLLALVVIVWAVLAKIDIVATGIGVVVPKGRVKLVQPLEPGIVTEIAVRDGQLVAKGELLVRMDATESKADITSLKRELLVTRLVVSRLNAQLAEDESIFIAESAIESRECVLQRRLLQQSLAAKREKTAAMEHGVSRVAAQLESVQNRVRWLAESYPLAEELFQKKKTMAERDMLASAKFLQAQMEINEVSNTLETERNTMAELQLSLSQKRDEQRLLESEYSQGLLKELTEARKREEGLTKQLAKVRNRYVNRDLRAPAAGIVQQLAINTVGGVVTSAQPLMIIVPVDSGLEIEAKILNKDIGFVREKMVASVKVAAYPFTRHGDLVGRIEWVGRDVVMDERLGPVYPVRISLDNYMLPNSVNGRQGTILPGMTVTTDIKVGKRRVIDYFLGPVLRYRDQSLREL